MGFHYGIQRVQLLGVVNATPNSFSDGGIHNNGHALGSLIKSWDGIVDGVDVGAESTAPMNAAVGGEEEKKRLQEVLGKFDWPAGLTLSLDTFRLETVRWLMAKVPAGTDVIWNDVSGDTQGVVELLKEFPGLRYVISHNPMQDRARTHEHMSAVMSGDIVDELRSFFLEKMEFFLKGEVFSRVIADPCFGFGKTREQNHELMAALPEIIDELAYSSWMWGVSRKSFIRELSSDAKDPKIQAQADGVGLLWSTWALDRLQLPHTIILRVHRPEIYPGMGLWRHWQNEWNPSILLESE